MKRGGERHMAAPDLDSGVRRGNQGTRDPDVFHGADEMVGKIVHDTYARKPG